MVYRKSYTITILCLVFLLSVIPDVFGQTKKKMKNDEIAFSGVSAFRKNQLEKVMVTRPSHLFKKYYFNREIFGEDLASIELLYRQNGYLDARIEDYDIKADSTAHKVSIHITVSEGEQTFIDGISFLGNTVYPDSLLFTKIDIENGDPFKSKNIDNATVSLLTFYADNGYLDTEIHAEIRLNNETHLALIDFIISEKTQYRIGDITIQGLEKTKKRVVSRELLFKPEETVNYSQLLKSQRNIYLTGLFESVHIRPNQTSGPDSTYKDILVDVKESMTGEFNVSMGYGSEDRARGRLEAFDNNLRGTSMKLGGTVRASFIERAAETSLTSPWTFGTPINTDFTMFAEQNFKPGYDLTHYGSKIVFGRSYDTNKITIEYRLERSKLRDIKTDDIPEEVDTDTHSIKLSFIHDSRDNLFNTTRGFYFELSNEAGIFYAGNDDNYYRCTGKWKYFAPVGSSVVIGTSLEAGIMTVDGNFRDIPLHERFYTGGSNSIRGFGYEKVGPLDSGRVPTGGKIKLVWNVFEFRKTIYKMIGGAVFTDAGMVWTNPKDVRLSDIRVAPGLGLRVNTPIGLGRLDYGFNIDRESYESPGKWHFSLGQMF